MNKAGFAFRQGNEGAKRLNAGNFAFPIMYLHLGQDFIVNTRDVIGVFDLDTATDAGQKAKITDEFLRHAQQEGAVVDVSGSMPKSFVLTDFPDDTVYITQISTAAIRNRAAKFDMGQ